MAVTSTPVLVQGPKFGPAKIVNADASALKTMFTAGTNGSKVTAVILTSDDTSSRNIQLYVTRSGTSYLVCTVTLLAAAGSDGSAAAQEMLSASVSIFPIDNDGNPYLLLQASDTLDVKSTTTVTAAKTVTASAIYGDF